MDAPFRAGDLTHGYQAVADNLPNDPRVHEQKGSKKIFFKNFMDARVNYVICRWRGRCCGRIRRRKVTGEGYLLGTIMHEIAHGLGPAFARTAAGKVAIREAIGPVFSGLEEAKADVVGMFGLKWLVDHGALPKEKLRRVLRIVCGRHVPHGALRRGRGPRAGGNDGVQLSQSSGARSRARHPGRYAIDYDKMPDAIDRSGEGVARDRGDRATATRAEKWFKKYDAMPAELQVALARKTADIPVDVDPVFSFKRREVDSGDTATPTNSTLRLCGNDARLVSHIEQAAHGFAAIGPVVQRALVHVHAHEFVG